MEGCRSKGTPFSYKKLGSKDLMYNIVIIVNSMVLYTWKLRRVDLKCSRSHTQTRVSYANSMRWWMSLIWISVVILQCTCVSNHHTAHFKYKLIFINYSSMKLKKKLSKGKLLEDRVYVFHTDLLFYIPWQVGFHSYT